MTEDKDATIARLTADLEWMTDSRNKWQDSATQRFAAGTYAQGIEAAADTDMIEQAMLDRQGDGADPREVAQYISDCIRALSPTPQADHILDDSSLRAKVGELGNQIHNLGCEYQEDEKLAERLGELRSIAWGLAQVASTTPQADPVREVMSEALSFAQEFAHGMSFHRDKNLADWAHKVHEKIDRALAQKEPSHD